MVDNYCSCLTGYGFTYSMIAHVSSWVLPVSGPPIRDGAVVVKGETIVAVGPAAEVLPGFSGLICEHGPAPSCPGW